MCWTSMDITVEVEAKAKEVAVRRLRSWLERRKVILWNERGRMPSSPPPPAPLTGQKKVLYKVLRLRYK